MNYNKQKLELVINPKMMEAKFIEMIQLRFSEIDVSRILETVEYIKEKHKGQFRQDNTPYYTHCLFVAINMMEYENAQIDDVLVCLLHDVIEDNPETNIDEIAEKFGKFIAENVLGLSKVQNGIKISDDEYYLRISKSKNLVLYKAFDRLSNIYSLYFAPNWHKRNQYIIETEEKILPIVRNYYPEKANIITKAVEYVKFHPIPSDAEMTIIEDLKKIRLGK